jgi:antibiotic biosynthesis monooxygenase (ABM) superfamily enzyme
MVIYEVNLTINNEIFEEYYHWLIQHIEIMLTYRGFLYAEIAEEYIQENNKKITVRYSLDNKDDLDNYLNSHAKLMRDDGIKRFGDKFSAFRRIFLEPKMISIK